MASLEAEIDRLYALPLAEFTAARNALAKRVPREEAARVKRLQKPTIVAWAVNQLYWHDRAAWAALMAAGRALRQAQIAALTSRSGDVRDQAVAHRAAVTAAAQRLAELAAPSSPASDQVARMLEAVSLAATPPESPGRFTDLVLPSGFEALSGITPAGRTPEPAPAKSPDAVPGRRSRSHAGEGRAAAAAARARAVAREQAQAVVTRAAAALDEAQRAEEAARQVLDAAREQLRRAEHEHERRSRASESARDRLRDARAAVAALD